MIELFWLEFVHYLLATMCVAILNKRRHYAIVKCALFILSQKFWVKKMWKL